MSRPETLEGRCPYCSEKLGVGYVRCASCGEDLVTRRDFQRAFREAWLDRQLRQSSFSGRILVDRSRDVRDSGDRLTFDLDGAYRGPLELVDERESFFSEVQVRALWQALAGWLSLFLLPLILPVFPWLYGLLGPHPFGVLSGLETVGQFPAVAAYVASGAYLALVTNFYGVLFPFELAAGVIMIVFGTLCGISRLVPLGWSQTIEVPITLIWLVPSVLLDALLVILWFAFVPIAFYKFYLFFGGWGLLIAIPVLVILGPFLIVLWVTMLLLMAWPFLALYQLGLGGALAFGRKDGAASIGLFLNQSLLEALTERTFDW